jgi:hypothetical protein
METRTESSSALRNVHSQLKPWDFRTRQKLASLGLCFETLMESAGGVVTDIHARWDDKNEARKFFWNGPSRQNSSPRADVLHLTWHPRRYNCFTAMIGADELVAREEEQRKGPGTQDGEHVARSGHSLAFLDKPISSISTVGRTSAVHKCRVGSGDVNFGDCKVWWHPDTRGVWMKQDEASRWSGWPRGAFPSRLLSHNLGFLSVRHSILPWFS